MKKKRIVWKVAFACAIIGRDYYGQKWLSRDPLAWVKK